MLANVPNDAMIFREETFGPVAPLFRFKTEEEAIQLANDTEFGLASYFYARDVGRIFRVAEALEYGIIGINEGIISTEVAPFGGMKSSGLGREGSNTGSRTTWRSSTWRSAASARNHTLPQSAERPPSPLPPLPRGEGESFTLPHTEQLCPGLPYPRRLVFGKRCP